MRSAVISIVFHSACGHTAQVAEVLANDMRAAGATVYLLPVDTALQQLELLNRSNTILFGSPTYFGNVSSAFKQFMDATGKCWYKQPWRNKLAGGFTVSSTVYGDKQHTLDSLFVFACQHGMNWISLGVLPRFINDQQTDGQNRLASYSGLMVQCKNSHTPEPLHPGDRLTAELFANRVVSVTRQMIPSSIN